MVGSALSPWCELLLRAWMAAELVSSLPLLRPKKLDRDAVIGVVGVLGGPLRGGGVIELNSFFAGFSALSDTGIVRGRRSGCMVLRPSWMPAALSSSANSYRRPLTWRCFGVRSALEASLSEDAVEGVETCS